MGKQEEITEGLLFDILSKCRAGHFTAEELGWAVDHPELVRWTMEHVAAVEALRTGRLRTMSGESATYRCVTYDQSLGLRTLIERAVGTGNLGNINSDITQERFPLKGSDVRSVRYRVEPYLGGETSEQAAARLTAAGRRLANTGDLAGFLFCHPEVVGNWQEVLAISDDSRWTNPENGEVYVPYVSILNDFGADYTFSISNFRIPYGHLSGVLVLCK